MIKLQRSDKFTMAIKRAKAEKLLVSLFGSFGSYLVTNRLRGTAYQVRLWKDGETKDGSCSCKAGESGMLCKHIASASIFHIFLARLRQSL